MAFRFTVPAAPGALWKAPAKRGKPTMGRAPRERDPQHLDAIRQCPCLACGSDTGCEAAHIRMGMRGGTGRKPSDAECVPLCSSCHRDQHSDSEAQFWSALNIDPLAVARALHKASPDEQYMRSVVLLFRAAAIVDDDEYGGD